MEHIIRRLIVQREFILHTGFQGGVESYKVSESL